MLQLRCLSLFALMMLHLQTIAFASFDDVFDRQKNIKWFQDGTDLLKNNLKVKEIKDRKAKGVILFVGDGMGFTTSSTGRVLDGQLKGQTGEENVLSWETFKNVAMSKTYNTNQQVPDSAGCATAFMTGVKSKVGVLSVDENVNKDDCSSQTGKEVLSMVMMAEQAGLSTGVVSTTRVTHATPASAYAQSASRHWENDAELPTDSTCKDIARQLIDFGYGDDIEVVLGGGRRNFYPIKEKDPHNQTLSGKRKDGRNLVNEWLNKSGKRKYIWNAAQLRKMANNVDSTEKVLGLFSSSHMDYNLVRNDTEQPSLTEMTEFAIKKLRQNPKGYFLLVEGGRIDHGHHENRPIYALHDVVQLAIAVQKAKQMTEPSDTLLVVTADHSHVFTYGGYPKRGNPIFGRTGEIALDKKNISTLSYNNGPGARPSSLKTEGRHEETSSELNDPNYERESLVKRKETHGGEDVGIYSEGPQSHLLRGVVEQNYIFHVMDYALCLSESKKKICRKQGVIPSTAVSTPLLSLSCKLLIAAAIVVLLTQS